MLGAHPLRRHQRDRTLAREDALQVKFGMADRPQSTIRRGARPCSCGTPEKATSARPRPARGSKAEQAQWQNMAVTTDGVQSSGCGRRQYYWFSEKDTRMTSRRPKALSLVAAQYAASWWRRRPRACSQVGRGRVRGRGTPSSGFVDGGDRVDLDREAGGDNHSPIKREAARSSTLCSSRAWAQV